MHSTVLSHTIQQEGDEKVVYGEIVYPVGWFVDTPSQEALASLLFLHIFQISKHRKLILLLLIDRATGFRISIFLKMSPLTRFRSDGISAQMANSAGEAWRWNYKWINTIIQTFWRTGLPENPISEHQHQNASNSPLIYSSSKRAPSDHQGCTEEQTLLIGQSRRFSKDEARMFMSVKLFNENKS